MRQASQNLSKETNLNSTTALSLRQLGIYLNDIKAEPVDGSSTQMKSHRNYIKEQEKRWSDYVNSFNRSASARVARNTEKRNYEQNEPKRSTSLQRRNSIGSRDKERKSQQVSTKKYFYVFLYLYTYLFYLFLERRIHETTFRLETAYASINFNSQIFRIFKSRISTK